MKEQAVRLSAADALEAHGKFCIELRDPDTGKVRSRVEEKNNVYSHLLNRTGAGYSDWASGISSMVLLLTDDTAGDYKMPFLLGKQIGCGWPSTAGVGTYRGSYNAANQILAKRTADSIRWKWQYDFTTAQANGIIGTIGLTGKDNWVSLAPSKYVYLPPRPSFSFDISLSTFDGSNYFSCSTAGVISKYSVTAGTVASIDVSSVVGTSSSVTKTVVYFSDTKKYGVRAGNTSLYVFSDNTFSTLEHTYSFSVSFAPSSGGLYGYGNYIYGGYNSSCYRFNFVSGTAQESVAYIEGPCNALQFDSSTSHGANSAQYGTFAIDKYLFLGMTGNNAGYQYYVCGAAIIDMSTFVQCGFVSGVDNYDSSVKTAFNINPALADVYGIGYAISDGNNSYMQYFGAQTKKKLDTPVTKTSANAMTVTYELEVTM